MTDPRIARLLAIAEEVRTLAVELGGSVHVNTTVWDFCGAPKSGADLSFFNTLPPGMSALDFAWEAVGDGANGKATVGGASFVVFLDAAQLHLVGDLLPKASNV